MYQTIEAIIENGRVKSPELKWTGDAVKGDQ